MFTSLFLKSLGALMVTAFGMSPMAPVVNIDLKMPSKPLVQAEGVQRFESCSVLKDQIVKADEEDSYIVMEDMVAMPMMKNSAPISDSVPSSAAQMAPEASGDYSQTNVQVEGVDEADILKMDGTYVYHLSKNRIMISQILPTESAKLVGEIDMDENVNASDFYIDDNRLMVMGHTYNDNIYPMPLVRDIAYEFAPHMRGGSVSIAQIWDISDRSKPSKVRTVEFDGSLSSSRMIDGNVYLVMNSWSPWFGFDIMPEDKDLIPAYRDSSVSTSFEPMVRCGNVGYFDPEPSREYLTVASVPMHGTGEVQREVILGASETVYASLDNLYVARQDWQYRPFYDSMIPEDREKTNIYKFNLSGGKIEFAKQGSVPGHLLNQFSLDEHNSYLRVATTKGQVWRTGADSTNNVYILTSNMDPAGKIEGIAPGESIYSMRFMGDRGYMVTFKKIDPFFVLDLKDPQNPSILGKLKIPGYSDYLHPMDENHIIGIGKDTVEAGEDPWSGEQADFAWYQGIKMAVFDVTDVTNPKELHKVIIGDRGTESEALHNHKAFLYSPSKQLLSFPVRIAELDESVKTDPNREGNEYGDFTFQGAIVYRLTVESGFEELGKITHHKDDQAMMKSGWYYGNYDEDINRVAYMDDSFLTLSNAGIQMHHLYDLTKQGAVDYPSTDEPEYRDYIYE
ncbi:MAG: beta-propeller domain-containing protein [Patescibacteria group bacterium]|nr:beta-propeller domain-containing protein [Patescibacteria group bacterium]